MKMYLVVATVLNLVNVLPPSVWVWATDARCRLHFATVVDLLLALDAVSLLFYFLFLRKEFLANKGSTMYGVLATISDTLTFKNF